jgi:hypothetical protein
MSTRLNACARRWLVVAALAALFGFHAVDARANWSITTLANNSGQVVTINVPVGNGGTVTNLNISTRGDLNVILPVNGAVSFVDMGHTSCPTSYYWWVNVTYNSTHWGIFYNGNGTVNMTINSNATVTFTAGPSTKIVNGTGCP